VDRTKNVRVLVVNQQGIEITQSQALCILKTGTNVFLTGGPGSGKTYVINKYVDYLRSHGIEPAITASTGIAATHIGGMTIHSWSGIGIKTKLDKSALKQITSREHVARRVRRAKILIIEEISMLTGETLSMVDVVCRAIKQTQKPFGGLQVIFAGDFFQLPPVVKREIDENVQTTFIKTSSRFAYGSEAWKATDPTVCYLSEQHRQDDDNFLAILAAIRGNTFNSDHLCYLEDRKIKCDLVPKNAVKLFSHNADVDRLNDEVLAKLPGNAHEFIMILFGPETLVAALIKGCLSPETLRLKVGAAVMFTKNNPKEGFVNGTLGTVSGFDKTSDYPLIKLRNGRQIKVKPMDWTVEENGRVRAQVSQLPLRLAWAITVHKSQGMNLDEAVMDLSSVFEFGQGYVALSRVRRLSGLYILGLNDRALQIHPEVLAKDEDFRLTSNEAEMAFSRITFADLQKRQSNFIVACGGKLKPISVENRGHSLKQEKIDTCSETLRLWNEGLTLLQIAKARELKGTTILNHIDKLVRVGNINRADLSRLIAPSLTHSLPKIHDAFRELDTDKLFPVFEKFNGLYSYDKLRLARLLLNKKPVSKIATQSKQSGFEKIREISPNAYRPWSKGQDEKLRELFVKGSSINDLINVFGRKRGAIRSRLTKLGFMKR